MIYSKTDCTNALSSLDGEPENKEIVENIIDEYFRTMEHMKETSLYDVYMYETNLVKGVTIPMKILANENSKLKEEVNQLRKKLKMSEKYESE